MVDCWSRSVRLVSLKGKEILLSRKKSKLEDMIIFVMSAKKLIIQGVDAYLAYIMDTPESKSEVSQGLVVCEFMDVFLKELHGVPKDREIEFSIELGPRTALISCMPYRMASIELKELKKQR